MKMYLLNVFVALCHKSKTTIATTKPTCVRSENHGTVSTVYERYYAGLLITDGSNRIKKRVNWTDWTKQYLYVKALSSPMSLDALMTHFRRHQTKYDLK